MNNTPAQGDTPPKDEQLTPEKPRDLHPWAADLPQLLAQVWARLARGVHDARAPARHPSLATLSPSGAVQIRTVVLRCVDPLAGTVDIFTDLASAKVNDLRAHPQAGLHIWDHSTHLQTRLEAEVEIITGSALADIWARMPHLAQQNYGAMPAPGLPIDHSLEYTKTPDFARFALLRAHITRIDALHLGAQHRRAEFIRARGWAGTWLSP